ncbi:MAG: IS110 family transposase [Chloroflexota bacterium]|nr:IS110 family transposase [Chloroflexota bacterium]
MRANAVRPSIRKQRHDVAGIDVGAAEHWVCVDPSLSEQPIRAFPAFTADLLELVAWLVDSGVRSVAMEATGVYWGELYTRLREAGLEVILADPRKTRNPRGRKTDMQDCQWIWELHAHGLLDGGFVPEPDVQRLRAYLRIRTARVDANRAVLQEMQRALSLMNIKLQHVISDIGGETGMAIIRAILAGERNPETLASLRNYRCRSDVQVIAKALHGTWRAEHLFLLQQAYGDYEHHNQAIAACDAEIAALIASIPEQGDPDADLPPKRPSGKNDFGFDAQRAAYCLSGVDLTSIDGVGPNTALSFIGEVGWDLSAWTTSRAFCCWLGLCPNPKRSGGKKLGNLPSSANKAAKILRHAAMGLANHRGAMGAFFRKKAATKGRGQAVKAVAHKLARVIYALFRDKSRFCAEKLEVNPSARSLKRRKAHLAKLAEKLGFQLTPLQDMNNTGVASC